MCKKLGIAFVAVLVGVVALRAMPWTGSHVRLWFKELRESVKKEVKPEREIARLKMEVERLEGDIKKQRSAIAEEEDKLEVAKERVADLEAKLAVKGKRILTMREDLKRAEKEGLAWINYAGEDFSVDRVKRELKTDFDAYTSLETTIAAQKKMLKTRENVLAKAREEHSALVTTREELRAELTKMEAELKELRAQQTRSKFHFDNSRVGQIKKDMEETKARIRVEKRKLQMEEEGAEKPLPVGEKPKSTDVLEKISNHPVLGKTTGEKVAGK